MSETRILAVEQATGKSVAAFSDTPVLSSVTSSWRGFTIERHRIPMRENYLASVRQYILGVMLGPPVTYEWTIGGRTHTQRFLTNEGSVIPPGSVVRVPSTGCFAIALG